MRVESIEWVEKAEGDWHTAGRELRTTEFPNYDAVCFHAQQCAEKYLKALLTERNVRFPKMHHLPTLLDLLVPVCPEAEACREDLSSLGALCCRSSLSRWQSESPNRRRSLADLRTDSIFYQAATWP